MTEPYVHASGDGRPALLVHGTFVGGRRASPCPRWRSPTASTTCSAPPGRFPVRFRGPMTLYLLAHPDAVKQVLQDNAANYPRPPFVRDRLQAIVGGGSVGAEGAGWVRSRKLAQPAFRRHHLDGYGAQFVEATTEVLDSWAAKADTGGRWRWSRRWSGSAWPTWPPPCSGPPGGATSTRSARPSATSWPSPTRR